jgi:hypothetical protein
MNTLPSPTDDWTGRVLMRHNSRGFYALLLTSVFGVGLWSAGCGVADTAEPTTSDEQAITLAPTDEDNATLEADADDEADTGEVASALTARQTCYSKRGCSGKVLSHRDRHNCKVKSRGKSWNDDRGRCFNL